MKKSAFVVLTLLSSAPAAYASFKCKYWNDPAGSGDHATINLKPISKSEPYMQTGRYFDLNISAYQLETSNYEITLVNDAALKDEGPQVGRFSLKAVVPYYPDATVDFTYYVKELDTAVPLHVQCTR